MLLQRMFPTKSLGDPGRAMDFFFNDLFSPFHDTVRQPSVGVPVDLWEDDDNVYAELEVPGVEMNDIEVSIEDGELSIKGERKVANLEGVTLHRRERCGGAFTRLFTLPAGVDAAQVEAVLKNGVLTITLPKTAAAKPQRITVKSE